MENIYAGGGSSTRAPKLKSTTGNISPLSLNSQNFSSRGFCHRHHHLSTPMTPIFDPYASSDSCSGSPNQDSPLIHYLNSSSGSCTGGSTRGGGGGFLSSLPLSAIDKFDMPPSRSLPVLTAPVKVEEDVIVMDGILVDSSGSHAAKSGGVRMKCTSPMMDTKSHFGSKCQFAHGKEELHPSRFLSKTKLEAQPCKLYSAGACAYGSKCRFLHNQVNEALPSMEASTASKALPALTRTVSPIKQGGRADYGYSFTDTNFANNDWCPLDDGIEVTRPSASSEKAPSKEDVNAQIKAVLYGPSVKKRLPVFTEFCPE